MFRSGVSDFKNNRGFLRVEQWEEYVDGSLVKKIVQDDGYGRKQLEKRGIKLNLDKIPSIQMYSDQNGYYKYFLNVEGQKFYSLQELIDNNRKYLQWEYSNETVDLIGQSKLIYIKKGTDYDNGDEWDFQKEEITSENSEYVKNHAKDLHGEWSESWTRKREERWAKKSGFRIGDDGAKTNEWNEQWYKKVKALSKKKDDEGNELSGEESDGSQIEESNCEKWGQNFETKEEWHEKWGEVHRVGKKKKWCDKWQVDKTSGLRKGENWGQIYAEDYSVMEHWAEKWDDRH